MTTTSHPNTRTVAIVSQKGGAGKTTLAIHLAAAATRAGQISLVVDTDPQASASQWAEWRQGAPPEIIDSAPPRIASKIVAASEQGADLIVIDTPPHADLAASKAVECADLVLIPCRPSAFDLAAMRTTIRLGSVRRSALLSSPTAQPIAMQLQPVRPSSISTLQAKQHARSNSFTSGHVNS